MRPIRKHALIQILTALTNNFAKVGVEGSNPFARSKLPDSSSMFGPLDAATYAADDVAFL
jgi:hypothetical protein